VVAGFGGQASIDIACSYSLADIGSLPHLASLHFLASGAGCLYVDDNFEYEVRQYSSMDQFGFGRIGTSRADLKSMN